MRTGDPSNLVLRAEDGTLHPLQPVNLIGREAECQIALADTQISRYHAKLIITGPTTVLVEDLRSTNGTFINGQRLQGPRTLSVGDELCLHQLRFRLATTAGGHAESTVFAGAIPPVPEPRPEPAAPAAAQFQSAPHAHAAQTVQSAPPNQAAPSVQPASPVQAASSVQAAQPAQPVQTAQSAQTAQSVQTAQAAESAQPAPDVDSTYLLKPAELERLQSVVRKDTPLRRPGAAVEGPCLVVLSAPIRGKAFALQPSGIVASWTIGRDPSADIPLIDRSVSKQHLRITKHGARWRIESLSATNHVFVNGAAVEAGELHFGDRIRLGRTELEFRASQDTGTPLPQPERRLLRPLLVVAVLAAVMLATALAIYFSR